MSGGNEYCTVQFSPVIHENPFANRTAVVFWQFASGVPLGNLSLHRAKYHAHIRHGFGWGLPLYSQPKQRSWVVIDSHRPSKINHQTI